jgi:hypothetical protein
VTFEMRDIGPLAGSEVVHAAHGISGSDQGIAEVASDEAGTTGDEDGTKIAGGHGEVGRALCLQR